MCGAVAGPNLNFDNLLEMAFATKLLIDPSLKVVGFANQDEANTAGLRAIGAVRAAAQDVNGGGAAKVAFIAS